MMKVLIAVLVFLGVFLSPVFAGDLKVEDPIEARLKIVAAELRCPVCQGESIYDSHSTVAQQMRALIREQIAAGKSDPEILDFFVARYGEFILMEPKKSGTTLMVWLFPILAMLGGLAGFAYVLSRRQRAPVPDAETFHVADTREFARRLETLGPQ
jgi:cytochrome c-type biogenesis protein CcmH